MKSEKALRWKSEKPINESAELILAAQQAVTLEAAGELHLLHQHPVLLPGALPGDSQSLKSSEKALMTHQAVALEAACELHLLHQRPVLLPSAGGAPPRLRQGQHLDCDGPPPPGALVDLAKASGALMKECNRDERQPSHAAHLNVISHG